MTQPNIAVRQTHIRVWSARAGLVRAAQQLIDDLTQTYDVTEDAHDQLLANFDAARAELRAAAALATEPFA